MAAEVVTRYSKRGEYRESHINMGSPEGQGRTRQDIKRMVLEQEEGCVRGETDKQSL